MSLLRRGLPWPPGRCSSLITANQTHHTFSTCSLCLSGLVIHLKSLHFSPRRISAPWSSMHRGLLFYWLGIIGNKTSRRQRHMCALSVCVFYIVDLWFIRKCLQEVSSPHSLGCRLEGTGRGFEVEFYFLGKPNFTLSNFFLTDTWNFFYLFTGCHVIFDIYSIIFRSRHICSPQYLLFL